MLQKNIFKILLLCLALAQFSFASIDYRRCRFPSNYTLRQASENDKNLPATIQLEKFIVDNGANLYFKLNEGIKSICNAVIEDLESLPNGKHAVEHFRHKIMEFEKKFLPCRTLHRDEDMMSIYRSVIDSYEVRSKYFQDDNIKLVAKALRKHDAFNLKKHFVKEITEFVRKFEQIFEHLREPIKKENIVFSEYLNKWYKEEYMTEHKLADKAVAILDLPFAIWLSEFDVITEANKAAINYVLA